jgi:hypothetical protein
LGLNWWFWDVLIPQFFPVGGKKKGINFPTSGEQTREKNVDSFHCRRRASIAAAAGRPSNLSMQMLHAARTLVLLSLCALVVFMSCPGCPSIAFLSRVSLAQHVRWCPTRRKPMAAAPPPPLLVALAVPRTALPMMAATARVCLPAK